MLKEKLLEDLKNSMKEKNINRKNVIQMVRAGILQKEKDNNIELDDTQIMEIISKEHKKREDSLEDYKKANREDLISQIEEEINVLNEYLPKKMEKEELEKIISQIIEETGHGKSYETSQRKMWCICRWKRYKRNREKIFD